VTATLSVAAVQAIDALVVVVDRTTMFVGAVGAVLSLAAVAPLA
jgi:hypothetical protein